MKRKSRNGDDREGDCMKKIDLHIHTVATVSDHCFEISMDTLQRYVESKKLDAIAVTNHNLFDRKQYEEICKKYQFQYSRVLKLM